MFLRCLQLFLVSAVLGFLPAYSVYAQVDKSTLSVDQDNKNRKQNSKQNNKKKKISVSESAQPPSVENKESAPVGVARQKEIFGFVQKHVPQIRPMLTTLERKKNKGQFNVAMRNLDREIRMLNNQKTRSPDRYPLSLKLWTTRYQIKLVAAKIVTTARNGNPKSAKQIDRLTNQMKGLIKEQFQLRRKQLAFDKKSYQTRIDRINKQLSDLPQQEKKEMDRQLESTKNALNRLKKSANNKKKSKNNPID